MKSGFVAVAAAVWVLTLIGPAGAQPLPGFKDCPECPEMITLPAGSFMMGASAADRKISDPYSYAAETPQHRVEIGYSFAIAKLEITVEQFAAFEAETGVTTGGDCMLRLPDKGSHAGKYTGTLKRGAENYPPSVIYITDGTFRSPGREVSPQHPATCISRREARQYLAWLNKKTGRKYRFPTEAEWEYAVRATTETPFHFGPMKEVCKYGNFADRKSPYHAAGVAPCAEDPSPPLLMAGGSYLPNAWGLHDMLGNAFEFIEDCSHENYKGAPADGSPWWPAEGENGCEFFSTRGYMTDSMASSMRSAARCSANNWDERANVLTIRAAVSIDGPAWDGALTRADAPAPRGSSQAAASSMDAAQPAFPPLIAGKWLPASTTSIAITGQINFTGSRVVFENGQSLSLARIDEWSNAKVTVYRVTPPADPVLENGNTLCGEPVSILTVSAEDNFMMLEAHVTENSGMCASYSYQRRI